MYREINSIKTWSSRKVEFLSEIVSFLPLKFEHKNFQFKEFYVPYMTLHSIGFKFFTKIMSVVLFVVKVVLVLTLQATLILRILELLAREVCKLLKK